MYIAVLNFIFVIEVRQMLEEDKEENAESVQMLLVMLDSRRYIINLLHSLIIYYCSF